MEPKPPDLITAAHNLQGIPDRVRTLSDSFRKANQKEKRLPGWKEYQLLSFIKYVGLYASDLNETYRANRLDSLAQAMRNLMELSVWIKYCDLSKEDGKRFFDDGLRDMREMMEVLQKLYTKVNKEPQKKLGEMLIDMKTNAPRFDIDDYKAGHVRVNDAAGKIGKQQAHSVFYKIASKFAHPTALLLAMQEPPRGGVQDSIYEIGAKLADDCLTQMEKTVGTVYPDLNA